MNLNNVFVLLSILVLVYSRPMTIKDVHNLNRLSGLSSKFNRKLQGGNSVFSSQSYDWGARKATTKLQGYNATGDVFDVTRPSTGVTDFNPVYCPGGNEVMFLSTRDKDASASRLFITNVYQRESGVRALPGLQVPKGLSLDNLFWESNGRYVIFTIRVYPDCDTLECTADRDAQKLQSGESQPDGWDLYDELYVRHWSEWEDHKVSHIFMQRLEEDGGWKCVGKPIDLMKGMKVNSPVPPFGGSEQIAISPDGTKIAFTGETLRHDVSWRTDWDTYLVSISNDLTPSAPKLLTGSYSARTQNPSFSPDSKYLLYGAMDNPKEESDRVHIVQYNIASGTQDKIAYNWDRSVDAIHYDATGKYLLVEAADDAINKLFSIKLEDQSVKELIITGTNTGITMIGTNTTNEFAYLRNFMDKPNDLWTFTFDANTNSVSSLKQVTFSNAKILSEIETPEAEKFYFKSVDPQLTENGIQGWAIKPYKYTAGKKYPTALLIHGGPEGVWNDGFSYRWIPHLWSAAGYYTFMINPRGSSSFGQAFTKAVQGDWGGKPFEDIMNGVEYIKKKFPDADTSRMCEAGASYGGFMTAWINGNTNNTFKCLVDHDGVYSSLGMSYSTEELFFQETEMGGKPWYEDRASVEKFNPDNHCENMNTPTLVIHGSQDFRIPIAQGLGLFTCLQRRGIESKFLHFRSENHWVLKRENSVVWYEQVLSWFDKHTKNSRP